jgi:hypothetical protein
MILVPWLRRAVLERQLRAAADPVAPADAAGAPIDLPDMVSAGLE